MLEHKNINNIKSLKQNFIKQNHIDEESITNNVTDIITENSSVNDQSQISYKKDSIIKNNVQKSCLK